MVLRLPQLPDGLTVGATTVAGMGEGIVEAVFVTPQAAGPPVAVTEVTAIAGAGLERDRYTDGRGSFSHRPGNGRHLTIIEAEALDALSADGIDLGPGEHRRNVVVRGLALNDLVGHRFRLGDVTCVATRLNPPCGHLQKLTSVGVVRGLQDRGGIRVEILVGGTLRVGDRLVVLEPEAAEV